MLNLNINKKPKEMPAKHSLKIAENGGRNIQVYSKSFIFKKTLKSNYLYVSLSSESIFYML